MARGLFFLNNFTKITLLLAAVLIAGNTRQAMADSNLVATENYRPEVGTKATALDIYSFTGAIDAPVMIYVHGGGWTIGDKRRVESKDDYFTSLGFVFISVNYRMMPDHPVETQLEDIDQAIGWVAANIADYGGDPDNLHLLGHSAGAHLVTMTGVSPLENVAPMIANGSLRSVISNDTRAYDIPKIAEQARGGKMPKLYGNVFGHDTYDRWVALSPVYHTDTNRNNPPFLIIHSGQGDDNERHEFAVEFAQALVNSGSAATIFDGRQYSHREINVGVGTTPDITAAITDFLLPLSQ